MQNAHLRLARLDYQRSTSKTATSTSVHVSHYMGEGEQAHLLSFFGNDAEVAPVSAAIQENHRFSWCIRTARRRGSVSVQTLPATRERLACQAKRGRSGTSSPCRPCCTRTEAPDAVSS